MTDTIKRADELERLYAERIAIARFERGTESIDERLADAVEDIFAFVDNNRREILAALRAQPGGAVPREPTIAMLQVDVPNGASGGMCSGCLLGNVWRAMHDAATKADAREDGND